MSKKVVDAIGTEVGLIPTFIFANDILFSKDLYVIDCINGSWNKFTEAEQNDILSKLSTVDYDFVRENDRFNIVFHNDEELNTMGIKDAQRRFKMFKRGSFVTKAILEKYEDKLELLSPESGKYCGDFGSTMFGLLNTTVEKVPFFFIYEEDEYGLEEFIINEMNTCDLFNVANVKELQEFIDKDDTPFAMMVNYVEVINRTNLNYEDSNMLANLKFINNAMNYDRLVKVGLEELIVTIL